MLPPENLRPQEQPRQEIYEVGIRIPLFRISGAKTNSESAISTYGAQFTLDAQVLPKLKFSVTLGRPAMGGHINFNNNPKQLRIEGDLTPLEDTGLATKIRRRRRVVFGPHEPNLYSYTDKIRITLKSLRFRVYDGEDGKIYEAVPSDRELQYGRLVFEKGFSEVHLDSDGKVMWKADKNHLMVYTLDGSTGGENTEAEFTIQDNSSIPVM